MEEKKVTYRKETKVIRDLVHGYIEIDKFLEGLINTLHFQRLRDIKQKH